MSRAVQTKVIFRSTHLTWTRDSDRTVIIDEEKGQVQVLKGLDAMVWSWLNLGYDYPRLVSLLGAALGLSSLEAGQHLAALLEAWTQAGLLLREETTHG